MIKTIRKRKICINIITMLLAIMTIFSSVMTVFAWSDFTQSKANTFRGTVGKTTAVLHKYEKDNITTPVAGAEFELYKIEFDGSETKIGGLYQTDKSGKITVPKLNSGNYFFLETKPGYGYDYDKQGEIEIKKYPFTIDVEDADATVEVTALNIRLKSSVEVIKTVVGTPSNPDQEFEFTIAFSNGKDYTYKLNGAGDDLSTADGKFKLKNGQKAVFQNVPVGVSYNVVEAHTAGFFTQSKNNQGTIQVDTVSKAEFTNTYLNNNGDLSIKKEVSGADSNTADEFEFKVVFGDGGTYKYKIGSGAEQSLTSGGTLKLKHNQTAVFTNLPVGMAYTVTELDNGKGYTATVSSVSGQVIPIGVTADFLNVKETTSILGALEIKKTTTGTGADSNKEFEFTVTFDDGKTYDYQVYNKDNTPAGGVQQIAGSGTLKLKKDQRAVFTDIPAGVGYTVTEKNYSADGYISSANTYTGTIPSGCKAYAHFNNHKDKTTNDTQIKVTKKIDGQIPEEYKDMEYWFTYHQDGEDPVRFYLKADEYKIFDVPVGADYYITEDDYFALGWIQSSVVNATGTVSATSIDIVFTNKFVGTVFLDPEGEKVWDLTKAPGHKLPESITVHLMAGDKVVETKIVRIDADGNWKYSFHVPKYEADNKTPIIYTIKEDPIAGYSTEYDKMNIKNIFTGETEVTVTKVWDDNNYEKRPTEVHMQLYDKGIAKGAAVKLNKDNNWTYTWKSLDSDGVYTVNELEAFAEYTKTISGDAINGFVITNTRPDVPPPPTDDEIRMNGNKIWHHGNNPEVLRPASIVVKVYDGTRLVTSKTVTENDHWQWHFNLPKYRADGVTEIVYTVDEEPVPGYTKKVHGYTIVNSHETHIPSGETVIVGGEKIWNHGNSPAASRPKSISVQIKKGAEIIKTIVVTESGGWVWSAELPKYEADGKTVIQYTIAEGNVPKYTHKIDGNNIINTYKSEGYPGDNPKTGDSSNVTVWFSLLLLSLTGLIFCVIFGRKRYVPRYKSQH